MAVACLLGGVNPVCDMTSNQEETREDLHFKLMQELQQNPDLSQRELADKLGISLGRLNYCLKALVKKGFVKFENFQNSKHKLRYAYMLTPLGFAQKMKMTSRFLKRKLDEYEMLEAEIARLRSEFAQPGEARDGE